MLFNIRFAKEDDLGAIAAMIMAWNRELPEEIRFFEGGAAEAERSANILIYSDAYITKVIDGPNETAGGYALGIHTGVFSERPYGQVLCWYVKPKYRGHDMLGLKMLLDALKMARDFKLDRLEASPWVQDVGTQRVLQRLNFIPACVTHMRKVQYV